MESAAEAEYAPAVFKLGEMFEHGHGVYRNLSQAHRCFELAARRLEYVPSMVHLAKLYVEGKGFLEQGTV